MTCVQIPDKKLVDGRNADLTIEGLENLFFHFKDLLKQKNNDSSEYLNLGARRMKECSRMSLDLYRLGCKDCYTRRLGH